MYITVSGGLLLPQEYVMFTVYASFHRFRIRIRIRIRICHGHNRDCLSDSMPYWKVLSSDKYVFSLTLSCRNLWKCEWLDRGRMFWTVRGGILLP